MFKATPESFGETSHSNTSLGRARNVASHQGRSASGCSRQVSNGLIVMDVDDWWSLGLLRGMPDG